MSHLHDVVVVGARAGGAATAMLLARLGHDGHHRLGDLRGDAVAVPGHTVPAVPVEVEAHGVELDAVTRRQRGTHPLQHGRLQRLSRTRTPPRSQPGLEDVVVVEVVVDEVEDVVLVVVSIRAATAVRIEGSAAYRRPPGQSVASQSRWPLMVATVRVAPLAGLT